MRTGLRALSALLLLALGCGRELAQTASRDPDATAALETSCEEPLVDLPAAPPWASGELAESLLTATSYGAGVGPGLFITARDAYRVYLNGVLLHESRAPRSADFVPLTLLPGENRLAIAVWAASGTPAVLLQLDELTESYLSDDKWRAELSPRPGFAASDYDAGAGEPATQYGRLGSLPGCDPAAPFPAASLSNWIGPRVGAGSSVVLHRVIRIDPVGFGENTRGGGSSPPSVATTFEELDALAGDADAPAVIMLPEGDYDFRRKGDEINERVACPTACAEDATKLQYRLLTTGEACAAQQVTMPMAERTLRIGSNKTIVGLGRGAHLRGLSLELGAQKNIIVRNLAVYDVNRTLQEGGDAVGMKGSSDVWLDHLTTKWIGDGLTDISAGTQGITLSWMHYDGANPADCRGRHTHASTISDASVTIHHSFFDHVDSHAPLVEHAQARVHVFNNLVQDNDGYGVGAACGAQVLLEGTTFRGVFSPTSRRDCGDGTPVSLMSAPAGSNLYLQDVGNHAGGDGQEPHDPVFEPAYGYSVDPVAQNWPRVLERAGVGGPWRRTLSIEP
jgi:pectate lyase